MIPKPWSSITVPFLHTYLPPRTPNSARREALWPNGPAWSGRPPACPRPSSRWQVKIPHEHAVVLSLAVTSQPGVCMCVCVCSCVCDFYRQSAGTERRRQLLELSALSLSPPCLSRISLQWGESTVERKPITRSVPPDPRWIPNSQVFPTRLAAARLNSDTYRTHVNTATALMDDALKLVILCFIYYTKNAELFFYF